MKEREISLTDLIVEVLLCWRMIVLWMLVGGVLMGGFGYVRAAQSAAEQEKNLGQLKDRQEALEWLEEKLAPTQRNNVLTALYYENFQKYYNHSLLTQIDAANVPKTELVFWVKADSFEQSRNIKHLYATAFLNGMAQWLTENNPDQADVNLSELITVTDEITVTNEITYEDGISNSFEITYEDSASNSFAVQIVHLTEKECAALADQVEKYIDFLHAQFAVGIGSHDIILANRSFAVVTDANLLNWQRTMAGNVAASGANADKLLDAFTTDEQAYYGLLKAEAEGDEPAETEASGQAGAQGGAAPKASVNGKYILLGMILFALMYVFYRFLKYILNNRLHAADDINEIYGLPQLGSIPQSISHRKFWGFVDNWILKLRNSGKRVFTAEEAIGLAAVAVKIAVKKEAVNEVFCIGCDVKERTRKVAEQLQSILKEENITMNILNNVLYDQEALEQLSSAECVFLLETAEGTFYDEIARELEVLRRQEIKVIGGIIVG